MARKPTRIFSIQEKISRIGHIVDALYANARQGIRTEAALESANDVVLSDTSLQNGGVWGHYCYDAVRESMAMHLALVLARIYDPGSSRYTLDEKDINSIPILVAYLEQFDVQQALCADARKWIPMADPDIADAQEAACKHQIDAAIGEYTRLLRSPDGAEGLPVLTQFRNCILAHSLQKERPLRLPKYGELFALMKSAAIIGESAHFAVRGHINDLTKCAEIDRAVSDNFWKRALPATRRESGVDDGAIGTRSST